MKKIITGVVTLAATAGIGLASMGVASASPVPASSHVLALQAIGRPGYGGNTYRPGRFAIMTGGPNAYARGLHWSGWGSQSATGRGTLVLSDAATWTVPGVTLHFSHPETRYGARFFENLHISGGKSSRSIAPYWHWSFQAGNWVG